MQEVKFYHNTNYHNINFYTSDTVHTDEELILCVTSASAHSIQTKNDTCIGTLKKVTIEYLL